METRRTEEAPNGKGYALLVSAEAGVYAVDLGAGREVVLGRAPDCDVSINDASMSRRHARLTLADEVALVDLGSKNGTKVRSRALARGQRVVLTVGELFELGGATCVLQRGPVAAATSSVLTGVSSGAAGVLQDGTMRNLYALLELVGPSASSVLLLGETGVGKQVYARALHAQSPRRAGPFVAVRCDALPASGLDAALFGALDLPAAEGGTLFLEEISALPPAAQTSLLRALELGSAASAAQPAGASGVRLIASTHGRPHSLVAEGRLRHDLLACLDGVTLTLPPLRDRRADIRALARSFAGKPITEAALVMLEGYRWPGNVRELRDLVDRAVLLVKGDTLDAAHLVATEPLAFGVRTSPSLPRVRAVANPPSSPPRARKR